MFDLEQLKVRLCASLRDLEGSLVAAMSLLPEFEMPRPMTLQQLVDEGVPHRLKCHRHTRLQACSGHGMTAGSGVQTDACHLPDTTRGVVTNVNSESSVAFTTATNWVVVTTTVNTSCAFMKMPPPV